MGFFHIGVCVCVCVPVALLYRLLLLVSLNFDTNGFDVCMCENDIYAKVGCNLEINNFAVVVLICMSMLHINSSLHQAVQVQVQSEVCTDVLEENVEYMPLIQEFSWTCVCHFCSENREFRFVNCLVYMN